METRQHLLRQMLALEEELLGELRRRARPGYRMEGTRVRIDAATRTRQRGHRKNLWHYLRESRALAWIVAPVIYLALIPTLILDAYVTFYQWVCFPAYGIPRVRRSEHFIMDRRLLPYLNGIEKLNCHYCSYFNGLVAYTQAIAARTEQHWCPIKHARRPAILHDRYRHFLEFGDAESYRRNLEQVRRDFADLRPPEATEDAESTGPPRV
ncbi:MAG TPA: hypothetical protein VJ600_02290 [Holophagaceae bacterium]|nr:hypothetical protein [Holophagaceae bacterium]